MPTHYFYNLWIFYWLSILCLGASWGYRVTVTIIILYQNRSLVTKINWSGFSLLSCLHFTQYFHHLSLKLCVYMWPGVVRVVLLCVSTSFICMSVLGCGTTKHHVILDCILRLFIQSTDTKHWAHHPQSGTGRCLLSHFPRWLRCQHLPLRYSLNYGTSRRGHACMSRQWNNQHSGIKTIPEYPLTGFQCICLKEPGA